MEDWDKWDLAAEEAHPIRYWIVEEGFGKVQDFVTWPARAWGNVRHYLTNRYVTKTHALTSTLKKGQWHEFETRLLNCSFDSLKDYVEIEEAWHHVMCDREAAATYNTTRRFWWNEWRCPAAGVDHLKWAAALVLDADMGVAEDSPEFGKPTNQALNAKEILALYTWWTVDRPARPDPYEVSGWNAFNRLFDDKIEGSRKQRFIRANRTAAEKKESTRLYKLMDKIESDYEKEDEKMLIRLVKIRKGMWT